MIRCYMISHYTIVFYVMLYMYDTATIHQQQHNNSPTSSCRAGPRGAPHRQQTMTKQQTLTKQLSNIINNVENKKGAPHRQALEGRGAPAGRGDQAALGGDRGRLRAQSSATNFSPKAFPSQAIIAINKSY